MGVISLLLLLGCIPVFAQQEAEQQPVQPAPQQQAPQQESWTAQLQAHSKALENMQRRWFPQLEGRPLAATPGPPVVRMQYGGTCSIPLLNAAPAARPVPMPKITPPKGPVDKLTPNSVPAPACSSNMAPVGAPATALPPPSGPAPGTPAPGKP
ncbi:MAG TPA: hypothetical protein VHC90_04070 [Bryobacteraceae bacterium]|nr:hypothetical protein [Bryobacteraceae bacterium]